VGERLPHRHSLVNSVRDVIDNELDTLPSNTQGEPRAS